MVVWERREIKQPSPAGRQAIAGLALLVIGLVGGVVLVGYLLNVGGIQQKRVGNAAFAALTLHPESTGIFTSTSEPAAQALFAPYRCGGHYSHLRGFLAPGGMESVYGHYRHQAETLGWGTTYLRGGGMSFDWEARHVSLLVKPVTDQQIADVYGELNWFDREANDIYALSLIHI